MVDFDVDQIVELCPAVLCLDTCTLLDLMRDPTRESVKAHERQAALDILLIAERRTHLVVLLAEQVIKEFNEHAKNVQSETVEAIKKLGQQLGRIDEVAAVYGNAHVTSLAHLDDHVIRARAVVDRWIEVAITAKEGQDIPALAVRRAMAPRTPAQRGKESLKDCMVIETYLEVASALRKNGHTEPIVFVSSNVKDYADRPGASLKSDLAADFALTKMEYAPNLAAAKHHLGIK